MDINQLLDKAQSQSQQPGDTPSIGNLMDQADQAYTNKQLETPLSGEIYDYMFSHDGGLHKAMQAFNQGASSQWGVTNSYLQKSQQDVLKAAGLSPETQEEAMGYVKAFNENFVRPVLKPFSEILGGGGAVGQELGRQLTNSASKEALLAKQFQQEGGFGGEIAGAISGSMATIKGEAGEMLGATAAGEYIPAEAATHLPEGEVKAPVTEAAEETPRPQFIGYTGGEFKQPYTTSGQWTTPGLNDLLKSRSEGNLGEGEKGYFNTVPPSEDNLQGRIQASATIGTPEPKIVPPEPDIHTIARQVAPDVFQAYDNLQAHTSILQTTLDNLQEDRVNNPGVQAAQKEIDKILSKVGGVESKLTNKAASRLAEARNSYDAALSQDTPEMDGIRTQIANNKYNIRSLQGNIQRAYNHAELLMPNPEESAQIEKLHAEEYQPVEETPEQLTDAAYTQKQSDINTIYDDVKRQLTNMGRDPELADAEARIVAVRYMSRADRLKGQAGSGLDLYSQEFPNIEKGGKVTKRPTVDLEQSGRRGSLTIARNSRNTLRLFSSANESTFMHEMSHQWLEELQQDAVNPVAPDELKADLQSVREWVGAKPGEKFTRAQHEKFARGFERYLMEGKAPTSKLASVFEKFKNWLINIYETVGKLRAPITDDIRQVYNRLISHGEELTPDEGPEFKTNAFKVADEHQAEVERLEGEAFRKVGQRAPQEALEGQEEVSGTPTSEEAGKPSEGLSEPLETTLGQRRPPTWKYSDLLKPVEGAGEEKIRGSARSLESRAIEEGIADTLGEELPRYKTINLQDQADKAMDMVDNNYQDAYKIAMGDKQSPEGLLPEAVFKAVEHDALAKGDVQTLMDLANRSRLIGQHTLMGQRLRVLGDATSYDFMTLFQKINRARREAAKKFGVKIADLSTEEATQLADATRAVEQAKDSVRIDPNYPDSNMDLGRAMLDLDDLVSKLKPGMRSFQQNLVDVINLPKSALTSIFHWSAPFVQGWGMMTRGRSIEAFVQMWRYFGSEDAYRELQAYILGHPHYELAKKARLGLTDISSELNSREESLQSSLLQRANEYLSEKTGAPDIIRASSRSFTGYLNYVRFRVFSDLISAAELSGENTALGSKVNVDIANVVNDFTGRSNFPGGGRFDNLQGISNTIVFSPKKQLALAQMFNPWRYIDPSVSRTARLAATRQLFGSLIATASVSSLAAACGADVNFDPRSSDFMKVNLDGYKFDMSGGVDSYLKLWSRLITGQSVTAHGELVNLGYGYNAATRAEIIGEYARGKLAPAISMLVDSLAGKDMLGRPVSIEGELMDKFVPITFGEIYHMINSDPPSAALYLPAALTIFGIQMQSPLPAAEYEGVNVWGEPSSPFMPAPRNAIDKAADKTGVSVHLPVNTIDGIPLTNNQYKRYIALSGQLSKQMLMPLISSDSWSNIPEAQQKYMIKTAIAGARTAASGQIKAESLGTNNDIQALSMQKKLGIK